MQQLDRRCERWAFALAALLCVAVASGCGSDDDGESAIPTGPTADLSEEISGGDGPFIAAGDEASLVEFGYVEREYVASGTAVSYVAIDPQSTDGRWNFAEDESIPSAAYRTRVLVRRPARAADFSGTVVVEWLNVSAGLDSNPDYAGLEEELLRRGHIWVGVSAQIIGVEGGPVLVVAPGAEGLAGRGLKGLDPARYGTLEHPGDGYSFDIYSQVGRALRQGGPALGGVRPRYVLAAGQSQSAIALVTYYNGVQVSTGTFDGFFLHSRASVSLPLVQPGQHADLASGLGTPPAILRTDLAAPALILQAEGDVVGILNSVVARQADSDSVALWEVAGTAHADRYLVGMVADLLECGAPINDGPMHVVAKAALRALENWVRTGAAPPPAPRLAVSGGNNVEILRDADGIALGGLRTPPVDVPVDVLSGLPGPIPSIICLLLGSTVPLPAERLAELYTSPEDYERLFVDATDSLIANGFALAEDRDALLAYANPAAIPN